ncbi:TIGR02530 family flagellar biosynthesis protein [Ammoniphilus sp. YIM 78166]|uniref:TIGR02530 family flagellar biosynthesis protein n=1 Tax=Ammoniphilus sp. YIM 78166 TaxID=1644106 RepID=UPI001070666A|nr:TIGR02530 family flagellar biosynthesis protein [Ammoniphilus sp. YIM 78166]
MKINRPFFPPIMPPVSNKTASPTAGTEKKSFAHVLQQTQEAASQPLQFSQHAQIRMQSRGIQLSQEQLQRLEQAVDKAVQKGGRETLVIMRDTAFIVSTQNRTVITAIDDRSMKDHVFTQIDSTILI